MMEAANWQFLERQAPGCRKAWERDVALPPGDFAGGVTGSRKAGTFVAVAYDRDWYDRDPSARRHFTYDVVARKWRAGS